jgi:hypothetical protein
MANEDIFHSKPAEQGHDPFWILVGFFVLTILASYWSDFLHVQERNSSLFDERWEYTYLFVRECGDLAFVGLFIVLIWFGKNRNWVIASVLLLGLTNFAENDVVRRSLLDGFILLVNDWEWELLAAAIAVIAAIVSMPLVKWLTRSKQVLTRSISIADIMLLTLASAILITSTHRMATAENGWGRIGDLYYGTDTTAENLIASVLLSVIGLTVVYVSYFGRLIWGVLIYLLAWTLHVGWIELISVSNLRPTFNAESLVFENVWYGKYDHYIPVFAWFLLCILVARLVSRFWAKSRPPAIANER